jgi:hypothetical protein
MEMGSFESQWLEMTRGLTDQAIYALERIREECQTRKGQEAAFFQWRFLWRKRVVKHPGLYLEAAAVHKAMRNEQRTIATAPGAFIYRSVESALTVKGVN